jgi:hypothetical protein
MSGLCGFYHVTYFKTTYLIFVLIVQILRPYDVLTTYCCDIIIIIIIIICISKVCCYYLVIHHISFTLSHIVFSL